MSISKIGQSMADGVSKIVAKSANASANASKVVSAAPIKAEGGLEALGAINKALVENVRKLKDVAFSKGIALNSDGSKFTGTIQDTLKNGDSIKLVYKNGVIQQSSREHNSLDFVKQFFHTETPINSTKVVKKDVFGTKVSYFGQDKNRGLTGIIHSDGREKFYNGRELKFEKLPNGVCAEFKDGKKTFEYATEGPMKGLRRWFDSDGQLTSEMLRGGIERKWDNGKLVSEGTWKRQTPTPWSGDFTEALKKSFE